MRLTIAFLTFVASFALAQDAASLDAIGIPKCAQKCIMEGNTKGGCTGKDPACGCGKAVNDAVTACFAASNPCSPTDALKAKTAGDKMCAQLLGSGSATASSSSMPKAQVSPSAATAKTSAAMAVPTKVATGLMGMVGAAAIMAL